MKSTKQREIKREGRGEGGEEDKNRKEKERKKFLINKRKYCVGTEPSALVYIGILVTFTTTGSGGSVVSALASQAKFKVRAQFPVVS